MIEIDSVVIRRGNQTIFENLSLKLEDPGLYIFAGPNFSGKTTLAQCLAGRLKPTKGKVEVSGQRLYGSIAASAAYSEPIFYAAAVDRYNGDESIEQLASEVLAGGNFAKSDAEQMLAWVETQLELPAGRSMASLSHSQRCLVEIALAVRCPCEVAVLDEHLTYLDGARLAMAGTLLSQNSAERSNKFIVCTATRLTRSMSGAKAVYALGGAYPTEAREVGSSETLSDELRPAHAPNALKVSFRMNPEGLGNITSTENLRVLSRHEDGLVISVKKSIDAALDDLHEFGLEVIAVEWEF